MPLSGEALNEQGNAITRGTKPANEVKWVTIATDDGGKSPTATATGQRKLKLAQAYTTGDKVVITKLNAKTGFGEAEGGLIVGAPYYARAISGTEIALAYTKAQAESASEAEWIEWTVEIKAETVIKKIEEHTGAKTKRKELPASAEGWNAAANLTNECTAAKEVEASATVKVRWIMWWSAETAGVFMGLEATAERELASGDLFKITNQKIQQNAYLP